VCVCVCELYIFEVGEVNLNLRARQEVMLTTFPLFFKWCWYQEAYINDYTVQYTVQSWGTQWRSWLRHCATSQKVAFNSRWCHWVFSLM